MTPTPSLRFLAGAAARRVRWRNGLGWTRELLCVPDADDWTWRLSIAEIEQTAPFSSFPGIDRVLVLLSGSRLRLAFDDGETQLLEAPYAHHRFAGERAVTGELLAGPTRDFNLMWKRDAVDAQLEVLAFDGPLRIETSADAEGAIHLLQGSAVLEGFALEPEDTVTYAATSTPRSLVLEGRGTALHVRIQRRS